MYRTVIYFRLCVLTAALCLIGFGTYAAYSYMEASQAQRNVSSNYQQLRKSEKECQEVPYSSSCEFIAVWENNFNLAVSKRDRYKLHTNIFLTLAIASPITTFILFYALRWVFTGTN